MIARNRKAIAGAVTGFFGALTAAVLKDGIDGLEAVGILGATVLGFVGVWATAANEPPPPGQLGEGRHAA
jgi:hypothetical protein